MTRRNLHRNDFATALKKVRNSRGLSQLDFSLASSRTHVSALERGIKKPALDTVEELAEVLDIHPLSLLALAYLKKSSFEEAEILLTRVKAELSEANVLK